MLMNSAAARWDETFHAKTKRSWVYNGDINIMLDHNYDPRLGSFRGSGKFLKASFLILPEGNGRGGTASHLSVRGALRNEGFLHSKLRGSLDKQEPITITRVGDPQDGLIKITLEESVPKFR